MSFLFQILVLCFVCPVSQAYIKAVSGQSTGLFWKLQSTEYTRSNGETVRGVSFSTFKNLNELQSTPVFFPDRMLFEVMNETEDARINLEISRIDSSVSQYQRELRNFQEIVSGLDVLIAEKTELASRSTTSQDARELLQREIQQLQNQKRETVQRIADTQRRLETANDSRESFVQELADLQAMILSIETKINSDQEYFVTTRNEEFSFIYNTGLYPKLKLLLTGKFIYQITSTAQFSEACRVDLSIPNGYWRTVTVQNYLLPFYRPLNFDELFGSQIPLATSTTARVDRDHVQTVFSHPSANEPYWDLSPDLYDRSPVTATAYFYGPCFQISGLDRGDENVREVSFKLSNDDWILPYRN